uniref:Uncharacterized protein n=1 Tax=Solanum tuberosum TaxID=4113 RepID=M1BM35_SOLTU
MAKSQKISIRSQNQTQMCNSQSEKPKWKMKLSSKQAKNSPISYRKISAMKVTAMFSLIFLCLQNLGIN